jgi:photosystem II stability/assembly factor-like uncharacterized protein
MKADVSRDTFRKRNHYSSVRLQQGRVVTDADWNEQADLTRHRLERTARDAIGRCGAPIETAGFELKAATYALGVFVDAANAWVAGEDGIVLRTQDAGVSWTLQDTGTTRHLRAIGFSGTTGWVVGDGGTVRKTTNSGDDWAAQNAGVAVPLRAIAVVDASHVWAVGDSGTIIHTEDGGTSWKDQGPASVRLDAVHFVNASVGFAVGRLGTILTTTDGGENWTELPSGTSVHLRAVCFVDANTGWVAGGGGALLKTMDGGKHWTEQDSHSTAALLGLAFRSGTEGWAVGVQGKAISTTDGGATWIPEDVGTEAALRAIALPAAPSPGWVVGDDSVVMKIQEGSPDTVLTSLPPVSLSIGTGRLYVDGSMCEVDRRTSFYNQPDRARVPRLAAGTHLLFVNVWQRHLSFIEEPSIREVALGGADTATRAKIVWQVKALGLPSVSPPEWSCLSEIPDWDALVAPPAARLKARSEPQRAASNVCDIAAAAGYRRLENQLYRVEVHGGDDTRCFKWSRENGSVAYGIAELTREPTETVVLLSSRGRDENLDVAAGNWLEVIDDDAALESRAGVLLEYSRDGNEKNEIVLDGTFAAELAGDPARHPLVRRWDHVPEAGSDGALPIEEGTWIELEEGVQVWFEPGGSYRPGDYWLIPARTITGDVEWPRNDDGDPELQPPAGIEDLYCRLALIEVNDERKITVISDCRNKFPPLSDMTQMLYVSGDGQDSIPGVELPRPLRVRVAMGSLPVSKARVRFSVEMGGGHLNGPVTLDVETADDGMAECVWVLGPNPNPDESHQVVRAALLDHASAEVPGQVIVFCATATVSLQYVGGDGQEGTAGQQLAHPLEVRVANGQRPVANARVRFDVSQGGGNVEGSHTVTITTGANGLTSVTWQLGQAGQPQRVEARLLDAAGNPIQPLHIAFNAGFRPQVSGGGGCAITIGEGGQEKELSSEVLRHLLEEHPGRVCICLLPGEHVVEGLDVKGDGKARVSIHGCGRAAVVQLVRPARITGFLSFELASVTIEARERCGFSFVECGEVSVSSITAEAPRSSDPILGFVGVRMVSVSASRLAAKAEGLAILFEDATPIIRLTDNEIDGVVSFYGVPESPLQRVDVERLLERMKDARLDPASGRVFVAHCTIQHVTVGRDMLDRLSRFASNGQPVPRVFSTAAFESSAIGAPQLIFAARLLTLTACSFVARPGADQPYGTFFSEAATATGNLAELRDDAFPLNMITRTNAWSGAANLILIRHQ